MGFFFSPPPPPQIEIVQPAASSVYIDMGQLYGTYVVGNMINWWPEPVNIDQEKLDSFLDAFFTQLVRSKVTEVELSFAQLCDIENLLNEQGGSSTDTITQIFDPVGNDGPYPVGDTGMNFLQYFIQKAHAVGIKVDLSFGGAIAGPDDMTLPSSGAKSAQNLLSFLTNYSIDAIDFDLEGTGATYLIQNNSAADLEAFFTMLHSSLEAEGKTSVITVEGSIQSGPEGTLASLFKDYPTKFDGTNLMLYSTSQYYLDAENETWGISEWIETLVDLSNGEKSASEILSGLQIGFYDSIDYSSPDASAGQKYSVPSGLTNGACAAYIYNTMQTQLSDLMPDTQIAFKSVFLWTNVPQDLSTNDFMVDFFDQISIVGSCLKRER